MLEFANQEIRISAFLVRFDVSTVVTTKNCVFWDVTPCGPCKNWRLGGTLAVNNNRRTHIPGDDIRHRAFLSKHNNRIKHRWDLLSKVRQAVVSESAAPIKCISRYITFLFYINYKALPKFVNSRKRFLQINTVLLFKWVEFMHEVLRVTAVCWTASQVDLPQEGRTCCCATDVLHIMCGFTNTRSMNSFNVMWLLAWFEFVTGFTRHNSQLQVTTTAHGCTEWTIHYGKQ
jgi:hypothetical protein